MEMSDDDDNDSGPMTTAKKRKAPEPTPMTPEQAAISGESAKLSLLPLLCWLFANIMLLGMMCLQRKTGQPWVRLALRMKTWRCSWRLTRMKWSCSRQKVQMRRANKSRPCSRLCKACRRSAGNLRGRHKNRTWNPKFCFLFPATDCSKRWNQESRRGAEAQSFKGRGERGESCLVLYQSDISEWGASIIGDCCCCVLQVKTETNEEEGSESKEEDQAKISSSVHSLTEREAKIIGQSSWCIPSDLASVLPLTHLHALPELIALL